MKRALIGPLVAAVLGSTCVSASDVNPLGIYVGAALGPSYGNRTQSDTLYAARLDHGTGWKVNVGLRPLPFLGAELEYIDFGSAHFSAPTNGAVAEYDGRAHATGEGLFAVGYLPIPIPALDLFAKLGAEHVRAATDGTYQSGPAVFCPANLNPPCGRPDPFHHQDSDTAFAYGAGVQYRLRSVALRAEYERTDTGVGHPALLSFGVDWTF